ncbi:MAG: prepilin-type N-terminal cleavage/methylation domain-containing protein [Patescibacteria group bacterium]
MKTLFNKKVSGKSNVRRTKGFSLVEVLIYLFLLTILLGTIINSTLLLARSYRSVKAVRSIESSAISSMDGMLREVRNAASINIGSSNLNINPGILALNTTNASGSLQTLRFYLSGGKVMMDRDGINVGQLTFSDSNVTGLVFRSIVATTSEAIKIEMLIESGTSTAFISRNFYGTAILRSSY